MGRELLKFGQIDLNPYHFLGHTRPMGAGCRFLKESSTARELDCRKHEERVRRGALLIRSTTDFSFKMGSCFSALRRGTSAFSLVEVMLAVAVFGTVILGTLSLVVSESEISRTSQERLYINRVLESRLEEVRNLTYDELLALPPRLEFDASPATTVLGATINPEIDTEAYERELTDASGWIYIEVLEPDLAKVDVEVTWIGRASGRPLTMNTATYVARNGVSRQ